MTAPDSEVTRKMLDTGSVSSEVADHSRTITVLFYFAVSEAKLQRRRSVANSSPIADQSAKYKTIPELGAPNSAIRLKQLQIVTDVANKISLSTLGPGLYI